MVGFYLNKNVIRNNYVVKVASNAFVTFIVCEYLDYIYLFIVFSLSLLI